MNVCVCVPVIGFVCSLHRDGGPPETVAESGRIGDDCPWDPATLPERLRGYGHRGADQDGYDGSEWITPQQDLEQQMIEAARVLLDAEEV
jgi:hypothetical protein